PDVAVVLADLAVELRIEGADREAGDLFVAEQHLLRPVVEGTLVAAAHVRLRHPAPAARVDRRRIGAPDAGNQIAGPEHRRVRTTSAAALAAATTGGRLARALSA